MTPNMTTVMLTSSELSSNVDHNIRTIDGMNTFHGMGMIAATTPAIVNDRSVPRITVSAEDISAVGTINILPFIPTTDGPPSSVNPCPQS